MRMAAISGTRNKLGRNQSGQSKSGRSKSGRSKSGRSKSGRSKSGRSKSGRSKSGRSKVRDQRGGSLLMVAAGIYNPLTIPAALASIAQHFLAKSLKRNSLLYILEGMRGWAVQQGHVDTEEHRAAEAAVDLLLELVGSKRKLDVSFVDIADMRAAQLQAPKFLNMGRAHSMLSTAWSEYADLIGHLLISCMSSDRMEAVRTLSKQQVYSPSGAAAGKLADKALEFARSKRFSALSREDVAAFSARAQAAAGVSTQRLPLDLTLRSLVADSVQRVAERLLKPPEVDVPGLRAFLDGSPDDAFWNAGRDEVRGSVAELAATSGSKVPCLKFNSRTPAAVQAYVGEQCPAFWAEQDAVVQRVIKHDAELASLAAPGRPERDLVYGYLSHVQHATAYNTDDYWHPVVVMTQLFVDMYREVTEVTMDLLLRSAVSATDDSPASSHPLLSFMRACVYTLAWSSDIQSPMGIRRTLANLGILAAHGARHATQAVARMRGEMAKANTLLFPTVEAKAELVGRTGRNVRLLLQVVIKAYAAMCIMRVEASSVDSAVKLHKFFHDVIAVLDLMSTVFPDPGAANVTSSAETLVVDTCRSPNLTGGTQPESGLYALDAGGALHAAPTEPESGRDLTRALVLRSRTATTLAEALPQIAEFLSSRRGLVPDGGLVELEAHDVRVLGSGAEWDSSVSRTFTMPSSAIVGALGSVPRTAASALRKYCGTLLGRLLPKGRFARRDDHSGLRAALSRASEALIDSTQDSASRWSDHVHEKLGKASDGIKRALGLGRPVRSLEVVMRVWSQRGPPKEQDGPQLGPQKRPQMVPQKGPHKEQDGPQSSPQKGQQMGPQKGPQAAPHKESWMKELAVLYYIQHRWVQNKRGLAPGSKEYDTAVASIKIAIEGLDFPGVPRVTCTHDAAALLIRVTEQPPAKGSAVLDVPVAWCAGELAKSEQRHAWLDADCLACSPVAPCQQDRRCAVLAEAGTTATRRRFASKSERAAAELFFGLHVWCHRNAPSYEVYADWLGAVAEAVDAGATFVVPILRTAAVAPKSGAPSHVQFEDCVLVASTASQVVAEARDVRRWMTR